MNAPRPGSAPSHSGNLRNEGAVSRGDPIVFNYTLVALIGLVAGLLIGLVYGGRAPLTAAPAAAHPRSLESHPG